MLWVIVFVSIAVVGLVVLVSYGVWLAHKTADVLSEVTVLAERGGQLAGLLAQVQAPSAGVTAAASNRLATARNQSDPGPDDVG